MDDEETMKELIRKVSELIPTTHIGISEKQEYLGQRIALPGSDGTAHCGKTSPNFLSDDPRYWKEL